MAASLQQSSLEQAPSTTTAPRRRLSARPVPILAACLLLGLLAWRHLVPGATPWLDIAAIAAAWAFLVAAKRVYARRR